jgi:hypothetical protein
MKIIVWLLWGAVALHRIASAQEFKKELVGCISSYKIKMTLERKDNLMRGVYAYDRTGKPITLNGKVNPNGSIELDEFDEKGANTGTFTLRMKGDVLRGEWKGGKKTLTVALYRATQVEVIEASLSKNGDLSMCVVDGKVHWLSIATATKSGENVYLCTLDIDRDNLSNSENIEQWSDAAQKTTVVISTNYDGKKEKAGEVIIEKTNDETYLVQLSVEQHAAFCGFYGILPDRVSLVKKGNKWTTKP